jgi:hypothetical protein
MSDPFADRLAIREVVENWVIYRDSRLICALDWLLIHSAVWDLVCEL